jgi:hypothetical protein
MKKKMIRSTFKFDKKIGKNSSMNKSTNTKKRKKFMNMSSPTQAPIARRGRQLDQ